MRNFYYQALTTDEELVTGTVSAASAAAALSELESQGLSVLLIRQTDTEAVIEPSPDIKPAASGGGEAIVRERLEQLLHERETLAPALAAFAEELPMGPVRRDLDKFAKRLQAGATVDELLHNDELVGVWLPLIGTTGPLTAGHLYEVFAQAEREYASRARVKRALAYPVTVFLLALFLLVILGLWIVPTFEDIFYDFGIQLPGITQVLLDFSQVLRFQPFLFVLGAVAAYGLLVLSVRAIKKWLFPSRWFGWLLDGNTQQVSEMALFVQHLKQSLRASLPLADSLELVGRASNHRWLRREARRLSDELATGATPKQVMARSTLPATVAYALQSGPQGEPNVALLGTLADNYFERVGNRVQWSTGFLPQLALLVVGFFVGMVVLALFLPLISLINGLTVSSPQPQPPFLNNDFTAALLLVFSVLLLVGAWAYLRLTSTYRWKSTPWWPADTIGSRQQTLLRILAVAADERVEAAPLVACLAEEHRGKYRRKLRRLARRMAAGTPLADALEQTPGVLSDEQALAIRFGDQSGTLPTTLNDLLSCHPHSEAPIASRIRQVMSYLIVTVTVLTIILSFIMIKIIPSFQAIFDDFDLDLSRPLVLLIRICNWIVNYWWILAIGFIALAVALRSERVKRYFGRRISSRILRPVAQLRSANLLGLLATNTRMGRPMAGALSTLARYHFDPKIRHKLLFVRNEVEQGADVWSSMAAARLLTSAEANALEKSASVDSRAWTIQRFAELKRERVRHAIDVYVSLLQPAVTLVLAGVVLFIAIACLDPLFNLVGALSG